jgi:serine protease Do
MRSPIVRGILGASLLIPVWVGGDTIQLKDQAALTGKILTEKKDTVYLDVGYTVLSIPKNQIVKLVRSTDAEPVEPTKASTRGGPVAPAPASTAPTDPSALYAVATGQESERSVRDLAASLGEAVVQVRTPGGLGSGFFLHEDGFLITNFHVIEGETKISIEVYHQKDGQLERRSYKDVRIVAMNKFGDLALLKVDDKDAPKFKTVPLGNADTLAQGDRVFAIGSPQGLERTVTEGIVSTTARQVNGDLYLQTTAQINPGNSGGPLFNLSGAVVGVTNMKLTFGEGLGFAIPVEMVKFFLQHRDAYAYDNDNPSNAFRYLEPPSSLKAPAMRPQ